MRIRALLFAGLFVALSLVAAPANAANQISGEAQLIPSSAPLSRCPVESGYPDYSAIEMTGSLEGCWYTKILTPIPFETTPSGVYLESGEEKFVGSLNGGPQGTFTTTYKFEAKLDTVTGLEIKGRCRQRNRRLRGCFRTGRFQRHHRRGDRYVRVPRSHSPRMTHAAQAKSATAA